METYRYDELANRLISSFTRRRSLGRLAAIGLGAGLATPTIAAAEKKEKKKKKTCPKPPRPGFCAGKNDCAQLAHASCSADGLCQCRIRADTAASFCGVFNATANSCDTCNPGTICTVAGGTCGGAFFCVTPCPNPL